MADLLTTREAADYLRLSESTLAHWRLESRGPKPIRHGRRVLYRRGDLVAYVDALAEAS